MGHVHSSLPGTNRGFSRRFPIDFTAVKGRHDFLVPGDGRSRTKGYTVRRGNYKGVVTNCSQFYNNESRYYKQPSPSDAWAIYDLSEDQFETEDVATAHPDILATLQKWVLDGHFTCACFQCGYG